MGGVRVGYKRVSSAGQNEGRQLEGVEVAKVFVDKASGKDVKRPALQELLNYVREGDTVVVHSMDRLARNLDALRKTVKDLTGKGIQVQFLKEGFTFTGEDSPMSNLMLNLLGAVAEFERSLIKERQAEGIALAKKRGAYKGRKKALTLVAAEELRQRAAAGEKKAVLAREYGVSRETVYSYINALRS